MIKKKPKNKQKTKITITINNVIIESLDKYIEDNEIYNKSELIENMIKKQIEYDNTTIYKNKY